MVRLDFDRHRWPPTPLTKLDATLGDRDVVFEIETGRGMYLGRSDTVDDTAHLLPRGMRFEVVSAGEGRYRRPDGPSHTSLRFPRSEYERPWASTIGDDPSAFRPVACGASFEVGDVPFPKVTGGARPLWLAENIDVLADALGMSLTVVATEVWVGDFRLDIHATDGNDRSVVIENQLERNMCQVSCRIRGKAAARFSNRAGHPRRSHVSRPRSR